MVGFDRRCGAFCEGGVDGLVEIIDVGDLGPVVGRDDEDGGGVAEAEADSKGVVGVNLSCELAGGVDDEGHLLTVGLEEVLGEALEVFLGGDGLLVGEDGSAIILGLFGIDLVLDVAGDDGGVVAPDVHLEGEVVAKIGEVVVLDGLVDDGEGVSAGGAFEIFELDDGDAVTSGRLEQRGVFELVAGVGRGGVLREGGCAEGEG